MAFQKIGAILPKSIKRAGISGQLQASMVCGAGDREIRRIFGDNLGRQVRVLYFKDNVLTLVILSSVLAQEIRFRESDIILFLNNKFGQGTVERIRYLT